MKIDEIYVCNICGTSSDVDEGAVFINAFKNGENIHICTSCMPTVIHGSGSAVKSNEEILKDFKENN